MEKLQVRYIGGEASTRIAHRFKRQPAGLYLLLRTVSIAPKQFIVESHRQHQYDDRNV